MHILVITILTESTVLAKENIYVQFELVCCNRRYDVVVKYN